MVLHRCLLPALLVLVACGKDSSPRGAGPAAPAGGVPSWAHVSAKQVAEARRLGVPAAFENEIGMRFVLIPAGTFTMGSPVTEESRADVTENAHEVTLTRPYYLQTTEVTNGQYRRFKANHVSWEQEAGKSLNGDEQPANQVSFDDAMSFLAWLNTKSPGRTYRLPTEAEWERACRAGTNTPFWWGSSITTDQANYDGNITGGLYGGGPRGPDRRVTVPVGTLPVSPWGLYEVHGNVREWCAGWYDDKDYPEGPATDPLGPAGGQSPLTRGGAFSESAHMLRAAFRIGVQGGEARSYVGFRVAASAPRK